MARSIQNLFPKLDVFSFLKEEDYEVVDKYMFTYSYDQGAYVFKEGAHGAYMFFIVEGTAEVTKQVGEKKTTVATLGKGQSLGEMSMLDGGTRSATVTALTNLTLIVN